jgi:mRNA interferase HigB
LVPPAAARVKGARLADRLVTSLVTRYLSAMQVIARRTLVEFWRRHPQAEQPLKVWFAVASQAQWRSPAEVKRQFGTTVDFVSDNRIVFDIAGNKFRLVVHVSYAFGRVLVKFVGTHAEYDRIDAGTISWRGK